MSIARLAIAVYAVWGACLGLPVPAADRTPLSTSGPGLGQTASTAGLASSIFPNGRGLPDGEGTANRGRELYRQKCATCHGKGGEGGSGGHLVGRGPLVGSDADKTVGNYWPYATTVFDFIRRSMPMNDPQSLSADEVYSLTAYLLHLNEIVGADEPINARTLPAVRMPNRDGFVWIDVPQPGGRR